MKEKRRKEKRREELHALYTKAQERKPHNQFQYTATDLDVLLQGQGEDDGRMSPRTIRQFLKKKGGKVQKNCNPQYENASFRRPGIT